MENKRRGGQRMNIFATDINPEISAINLCDKHIIKMILESAQILCTVRWSKGLYAPYNPTHTKHPCVLWAKSSLQNYE
jgi:hypothetical protein